MTAWELRQRSESDEDDDSQMATPGLPFELFLKVH